MNKQSYVCDSNVSNSQQDLDEILQVVLDELKGVPLAASKLIFNTRRTRVSCSNCVCSCFRGKP